MQNKKHKLKMKDEKIFLIFGLCFLFFIFNFSFSFAQTQYNLIEPLPGLGQEPLKQVSGFPEYISRIIPFLLAFAALAAFVQIVFGGILRATSGGNPTAIGDANDRIWQAILGLVLAFSAYLILRTINPDLVSLKFLVPEVTIAPTQIPNATPVPSTGSGEGTTIGENNCYAGKKAFGYPLKNAATGFPKYCITFNSEQVISSGQDNACTEKKGEVLLLKQARAGTQFHYCTIPFK